MVNKNRAQLFQRLNGTLESDAGVGMPYPDTAFTNNFSDERQDAAKMYVKGVKSQMYNTSIGAQRVIQNTVRLRTLQYDALLTQMGYVPNSVLKRFIGAAHE